MSRFNIKDFDEEESSQEKFSDKRKEKHGRHNQWEPSHKKQKDSVKTQRKFVRETKGH